MKQISKMLLFLGLLISLAMISGCGGGSDGGGGGTQWVTYTGSTSMATIDETNASVLTLGTYSNLNQMRNNQENLDDLMRVLTSLAYGNYTECGGTYSEQPESDNSGTIIFSNFCIMTGIDEIVLDGAVYFSDDGQKRVVKMSNFSLKVNGVAYTVSATFKMEGNSVSMDFVGVDGKTYRIENLVVQNSSQVPGGVDIISGRFYHPDHGYVDIHSDSPVVSDTCDNMLRPTQGKVIANGANGTDASVTYQGCAEYTVCTSQDTMCNTYQW